MIISERIFYIMEQKNMSQLELSRRTRNYSCKHCRMRRVATFRLMLR